MLATKQPTIIFDMDDVVAMMRFPLSDVLARMSGKEVPHEHWHTLCTNTLYGIDFCADTLIRERVIERCEPEADARAAMHSLREAGFRLAIATARGWHPEGAPLTEAWLSHHDLPFDELHVVGLGKTSSKTDVFDLIARHHAIHGFIDDQPRYLKQADDHHAVERVMVMDRPWNRDTPLPRVTSLNEFAECMVR